MEESLTVEGLSVRYGKVEAVRSVSLVLRPGDFLGVVGPNGAGKSTTVSTIAGLLPSIAGKVIIDGSDVTDLTPEERVRLQLAFVPENRGIFGGLTVAENLRLGSNAGSRKANQGLGLDTVTALFPFLAERETQAAGLLSGGEQQQLAIARALLTKPKYLVVDEPSLGLAPLVVTTVYEALRRIRTDFGLGVLVVEQSLRRLRRYANRVIIMRQGQTLHEQALSDDTDLAVLERSYFGLR